VRDLKRPVGGLGVRVKEGENEGKKATDLITRIGGWPKLQLASPPDAARCMRCPEGSHSFVDMAGGLIASSEEESRYLDGSGMGLGWVWDGSGMGGVHQQPLYLVNLSNEGRSSVSVPLIPIRLPLTRKKLEFARPTQLLVWIAWFGSD